MSSAAGRPTVRDDRLEPRAIDVPTLAWLAGAAANEHLLRLVRGSRHPRIRNAHGYVFQHLIGRSLTIGQLAERMGVTQQAASKVIAELEELGYVERREDPEDKRIRRLALTRRGTAVVERARAARARLEARLEAAVGSCSLETARDVLVTLLDLVGGLDAVTARKVLPPSE